MPDTAITSETTSTPQPQQTLTPTPAPVVESTPRSQLYDKYYAQNQPTQEAAPVTSPTVATEPTTQTEVAQVSVPTPPAPQPEDSNKQLLELIGQLKSELAEVKQTLTKPTTPDPASIVQAPSWLELLKDGKVEEAEAALAQKIKTQILPEAVSTASTDAREKMQAEYEIQGFIKDLRTNNPDLMPLEAYIANEAQSKLNSLQSEGKIKSTRDFVDTYKRIVSESLTNARNIARTLRGQGKQEGLTIKQEVLSASTVAPNPVQTQPQTTESKEPQPESSQDYIAKRQAWTSQTRGLSN